MDKAIIELLSDIVAVLCYQPDIPEEHKTSMVNKLDKITEALQRGELED